MESFEKKQIGALVAENYHTATVFKKHNIDFCCQGGRTIDDACKDQNVSRWDLLKELEEVMEDKQNITTDYNSWPLNLLADYIEQKHHRYVEKRITEIRPFLDKICRVHGKRHPELNEINNLFIASSQDLAQHMKKEELILFPFIRKLIKVKDSGEPLPSSSFGTVENPIKMMMHEHDEEGARFRKIAELSNNYQPPADACSTYSVTMALLKEFEDDLHLHIHLENNILFPKATVLEKEINT